MQENTRTPTPTLSSLDIMSVVCDTLNGGVLAVTEFGDLRWFSTIDGSTKEFSTDNFHGDPCFDGSPVLMISMEKIFKACVTEQGEVWFWNVDWNPTTWKMNRYGNSRAVMVACGKAHCLVLTAAGRVWSTGRGGYGVLGHGSTDDSKLRQVRFGTSADADTQAPDPVVGTEEEPEIVMIATTQQHCVALGKEGGVWTWGRGTEGKLGHRDLMDRLIPTRLPALAPHSPESVVLVATGKSNTLVVTDAGSLWGCGSTNALEGRAGAHTQLQLIGAAADFQGSGVLSVACGHKHILVVTQTGALWTAGCGKGGALGHGTHSNLLKPAKIRFPRDDIPIFVSVSANKKMSSAVTEDGRLFTWGHDEDDPPAPPHHLNSGKLASQRIGRYLQRTDVSRQLPLAFAMATHARLGAPLETTASTRVTRARRARLSECRERHPRARNAH
jgi:hypothetical protein